MVIGLDGSVVAVIAVSCLQGVFMTVLQPAVSSMLPGLCKRPDELTAANVLNSTIDSVSIFVGPRSAGSCSGQRLGDAGRDRGGGFLLAALLAATLPEERGPQPADAGADNPVDKASSPPSAPGFAQSPATGGSGRSSA